MNGIGLGNNVGRINLPIGRLRRPRQAFASRLMNQGSSTAPVQHWAQGLGRMGQMLLGVKLQQQIEEQDMARQSNMGEAIRQLMQEKIIDQEAIPQPAGLPNQDERLYPGNTMTTVGQRIPEFQTEDLDSGESGGRMPRMGTGDMVVPPDITETNVGPTPAKRSPAWEEMYGDSQAPLPMSTDQPMPFNQAGGDYLQVGQQFMGQSPEAIQSATQGIPEKSHMELGKLGKMLLAMNQNTPGGMDPSILANYQIGQEAAKTKRAQQLADLETAHKYRMEEKAAPGWVKPIPPKRGEKHLPSGKVQPGLYDAAGNFIPSGSPYDPNIKTPEAQQQAIERAQAGKPTWQVVQPPGSRPVMQSSTGEIKPLPQGVASKKVDESFGKFYSKFYVEGGRADYLKGLSQVNEIASDLEAIASGADKETVLSGKWTGLTPDWAQSFINPEALDAQETIAEVTQRNLKAVLGGQFSEREGENLVKRAFNPSLPEAENAARVKRLVTQMKLALEAKDAAAAYYRKHGTIEGFTGKQYTLQDFYDAIDGYGGKKPKGVKKGELPPGFKEVQ